MRAKGTAAYKTKLFKQASQLKQLGQDGVYPSFAGQGGHVCSWISKLTQMLKACICLLQALPIFNSSTEVHTPQSILASQ